MSPSLGTKVHRNLAVKCSAEASSQKSAERSAGNVVDGSAMTRWTSVYEDGQWIALDLGAVYSVSEVRIRWEMACAESYLIQGSTDGQSYTTLAQEMGHEGWVVTALGQASQARWVRVFGQTRATAFGFSIWDIHVMGSEVAGSTPALPAGMSMGMSASMGPNGPSTSKPSGLAAWNGATWYDVVHDRVAVRGGPSTKAKMISAAKKGEGFRGTKHIIEGQPWLRLDQAWVEECRKDIPLPKGVEGLFVLIDGKSVGLGELLRPGVEPAETASKARGGPPSSQPAVKTVPAAPAPVKAKAPTPQPYLPESEWIVNHEKVVERSEPNVNADAKKVREKDELVVGTPCHVGGGRTPWLQLRSGNWILMDGRAAGVPGKLLVPAADIAQDMTRWADQHRNSEAGKKITWTAQTDAELKRINEVTEKQVEQLRPMMDFQQVVKRLEEDGFIQRDDFTLGPDGIVKAVRRKLLRLRVGVTVLSEEMKETDRLPWSEEDFPQYLAKVIPEAPFYCRTFAPEESPTRLLILLHGSLVCGDDLVGEAETLRSLMPETAVVLPQGPVLVSQELGLRVWWTPPDDAPKDITDIREARRHGLLKAPTATISRAVATVKWAVSRFKNIPFIVGGFSQGSMLIAQSLEALRAQGLEPRGLLILSGLVMPFTLPSKMFALAIHGDQDERVEVDVAREVARNASMHELKLEEIKGMGHEISDAVVDRTVKFCDEVAPVARTLSTQEESDWLQEVNQAKLLRWVKKVSQVITMFDDDRFMSHIVHLNMLGLGSDCPGLGKGPLLRYYVHDAGPESRGTVILFHGKVYDLKRETRHLVEAYQRLKLSVAIIDYRQKFSQFCVDATVVLEALDEITGSESSPIIIHAVGCGAIAGLHMAIASHAYPSSLKRRLRLLVLDGAVGNFKSLPPSPTGCIATDPIGNDEKLKYIGLPLVLIGGDDACCGLKWSAGHWTVLGRAAEALHEEKKIPALTTHSGTALMPTINEARLCPELYTACQDALENINRSSEAAEKFAEDVLSSADITDQSEFRKFKEDDLRHMVLKVLKDLEQPENQLKLWSIRGEREPRRGEELTKFTASLHMPYLEAHGGFNEGYSGYAQFEAALKTLSDLNPDLKKAKEKLKEALNLRKLDEQAQKCLEDKGKSHGITIGQCHGILDSAITEWQSQELLEELETKVRERGGTSAIARQVVKEHSLVMNVKRGQALGIHGSEEEVSVKLGSIFGVYQQIDPTLGVKMRSIQEGVMQLATRLHEMFKPKPAVKATAAKELKDEAAQDVQVTIEHATEGGTIHILAKSTSTMMEIRRTVMGELGEMKLSQVKLVSRLGQESGFQGLADDAKLGERRHLLMMGRSLRSEAAPDPEVELIIHIDRNFGLVAMTRVPRTATIAEVKAQLAKDDSSMDPSTFELQLPGSSACLTDDQRIEGTTELDLCPVVPPEPTQMPSATRAEDIRITVHIHRALGLSTEMILRPGSRIYAVKEQLAEADPTGTAKPEDFSLRLPDAGEGFLLDDALPITGDMDSLEVVLPE